jgi:hypothetical protein
VLLSVNAVDATDTRWLSGELILIHRGGGKLENRMNSIERAVLANGGMRRTALTYAGTTYLASYATSPTVRR